MRKFACTVSILIAMALSAFAQGPSAGIFYASDFGRWQLPQGTSPTSGMIQWPSANICSVTSGGYTFTAVKVGRPLIITDIDPSHTETVIPTAVTINGGSCSVTAPMLYTHTAYTVESGTAGLQEAIDYGSVGSRTAQVILTPGWSLLGGQTGTITSATGNTNVTILDQRSAMLVPYLWTGAAYAASRFPTGAGGTPSQTQFNCSGLLCGSLATLDAPGNLSTPGSISLSSMFAAAVAAITALGNSITEGLGIQNRATGTYPAQLSALIGYPVNNLGACSQTSTQIAARAGAIPLTVTVTGNGGSIPTSGTVTVAFSPVDPAYDTCNFGFTVAMTIGGVVGTVQYVGGVDVFTPTTYPASPVTVAAGSSVSPVLGTLFNGWTIIEAGRNDFTNAATVEANVDAIVAALPSPKHFLVLSIINGDNLGNEISGTTHYNQIVAINAHWAAEFPSNYFDIRAYLISQYDPTSLLDVLQHSQDIVPASLRYTGNQAIGAAVTTTAQTTVDMGTTGCLPGSLFFPSSGEYMEITACAGQIATVTRGAGGSPTSTYLNGAAYVLTDSLHPNNKGAGLIAAQVSAFIQANSTAVFNQQGLYQFTEPINALLNQKLSLGGLSTTKPLQTVTDLNLEIGWPWSGIVTSATLNSPTVGAYIAWNAALGDTNFVIQFAEGQNGIVYNRTDWGGSWSLWLPSLSMGAISDTSATTITDLNTQTKWPFTGVASATTSNTPVAGTAYVAWNAGVGVVGYVPQFAEDQNSNLYKRIDWAGTFSPWKLIDPPRTIPWTGRADFTPACAGGTPCAAGNNVLPMGSAATLTYFSVWYGTAGAGCTTAPVISVYDQTSSTALASLTLTNGTAAFNSGTISVAIPASHTLQMRWTTVAVGCTQVPFNLNFEAVYQ